MNVVWKVKLLTGETLVSDNLYNDSNAPSTGEIDRIEAMIWALLKEPDGVVSMPVDGNTMTIRGNQVAYIHTLVSK